MPSKTLIVKHKKGVKLNLSTWGTGSPRNDKRAHAPGREQIYLSSRCKNYQFSS